LRRDGVAVLLYASGPLTLLNCDIKPEQVKLAAKLPALPAGKKTGSRW